MTAYGTEAARLHAVNRAVLVCLAALAALHDASVGANAATAAQEPAAADAQVVQEILTHWKRRRDQARAVKYYAVGKQIVPKGTFDGEPFLPKETQGIALKEDYSHDYSGEYLFDFEKNRFRIEETTETFNLSMARFFPDHDRWTFDGKELRCHRLAVTENRGTLYGPTQPEFVFRNLDYPVLTVRRFPVLVAHGIVLAGAKMKDIGHLRNALGANQVTMHGRAVLQGRECTVLRSLPKSDAAGLFFEYWVDVARDAAVVRVQRFEPALGDSVDIQYEQKPQGWFPTRWSYTSYDLIKKVPERILTVKVKQFELNPDVASEDFQIAPVAGMVVSDEPNRAGYVLGPDGSRLPPSVALTGRRAGFVWRTIVAVVSGVALLALVLLAFRQRLRASKARAP